MDEDSVYECEECGSTWTIQHNNYEDVSFCPFCGEELYYDEEDEEDWDEPEDDYE
jgi:DNA-directed RNA polymerase subunit M/transcription elongation factor TFIIS